MTQNPIYNVDYFIEKFSKIPEELWITGTRCKDGKRCALGFCYKSNRDAYDSMHGDIPTNEEEKKLNSLIRLLQPKGTMYPWAAGGVNNGIYKEYPQPTPKQRILAALYDIKKLQEKDLPQPIPEQPKERVKTVYVTIHSPILKSAEVLITNQN